MVGSNGNPIRMEGMAGRIKARTGKRIMAGVLAVTTAGFLWVSGAGAAITYSGDATSSAVGNTSVGSLTVDSGSIFSSSSFVVGKNAGSSGTVCVDGDDSTLTGSNTFYVGYNGTGMLSVTNGGAVVSTGSSKGLDIGRGSTGTGTVIVDGAGSTLTAMTWGMRVGYGGSGALIIRNGASVSANGFEVGLGSSGSVTVDGAGTTLITTQCQIAENSGGKGKLTISNGGTYISGTTTSHTASIGASAGDTAYASVDGTGSTWTHTGTLAVGASGTGYLSIGNGGTVTANAVSINSTSTLTTDVGYGSSLTVGGGTGTITNNGTVRLVAGSGAASGTYTPMSFTGTLGGTVQALGGTWDGTTHLVTVADAVTGSAGTPVALDLATHQRALITDSLTGKSVGAGFLGTDASTPVTFTATAIGGSELTSLEGLLSAGQAILSGWDLSTEGYTVDATHPVYLSLFAGADHSLSDLTIWHYDDGTSTWSEFDAWDLAYDNTYASFTVTDFSDYAVTGTAPVPLPAAAWLLAPGLAGLIGVRRRLL